MRVAVVTFPGSNCDMDTVKALTTLGVEARTVDHRQDHLGDIDAAIIPGGFSYGDYLRSGALAAKAPVILALKQAIEASQLPVLGICNGFQILTEAGLLPGVLRPNRHGEFRCDFQTLRVVTESPYFPGLAVGDVLKMPIAHGEGAYYTPPGTLEDLFRSGAAWLQYVDTDGQLNALANPNGSVANLAGVMKGSVAALMPHPERAMHQYLGSQDGRRFLSSWLEGIRQEVGHASV
ncbi:phosphoribosylformylglycinamidine synthase I [Sulfobacillus harzensis]|uniref:Phosphoribosylformylglycinamidine synthase subunit PurQ n=1 Tax=Sulfobacillus harzensis TaxID=2729629 RepID=A0A7Y0Q372_9FIRM|nr:phosphoribosylformylglycinamidine synthase I [Sulfobacillus harzensis]NMP23928.1 phosphoribosylformylglycinamidine synthase I [Sulfobacillus harzensis]